MLYLRDHFSLQGIFHIWKRGSDDVLRCIQYCLDWWQVAPWLRRWTRSLFNVISTVYLRKTQKLVKRNCCKKTIFSTCQHFLMCCFGSRWANAGCRNCWFSITQLYSRWRGTQKRHFLYPVLEVPFQPNLFCDSYIFLTICKHTITTWSVPLLPWKVSCLKISSPSACSAW